MIDHTRTRKSQKDEDVHSSAGAERKEGSKQNTTECEGGLRLMRGWRGRVGVRACVCVCERWRENRNSDTDTRKWEVRCYLSLSSLPSLAAAVAVHRIRPITRHPLLLYSLQPRRLRNFRIQCTY